MEPAQSPDANRRLVVGLFLALAVWGLYLAVGSYVYKQDVRRPLIVFGCVAAFLGLWFMMLAVRNRRRGRSG